MGYGHQSDEVLGLNGRATLVHDQEREKQGRLAAFLSQFVRLTAVGLYREIDWRLSCPPSIRRWCSWGIPWWLEMRCSRGCTRSPSVGMRMSTRRSTNIRNVWLVTATTSKYSEVRS